MSKKRIAILGAGPSGLAQLRAFEAARLAGAKNLPEIVCYETVSYTHLTLPTTPYV